jgi:hypothetical protein
MSKDSAKRHEAALALALERWAGAAGVPAPVPSVGALARFLADAWARHDPVPTGDVALVVRLGLEQLARLRPGRSVELRVPPYAAVQLGTGEEPGPGAGPRHTRGTPPAVVETDPATLVHMAAGRLTWAQARDAHRVSVSGAHTDLTELFPLP